MLWMEGRVGARASGPWRSAAFPRETFRFPPTMVSDSSGVYPLPRPPPDDHIYLLETHYSYTPSDARAARALCGDDVRAERAPRVRGVKETPWGIPGMHVAHFRPMCLTAWNSLRPPKSPIMSRTGLYISIYLSRQTDRQTDRHAQAENCAA